MEEASTLTLEESASVPCLLLPPDKGDPVQSPFVLHAYAFQLNLIPRGEGRGGVGGLSVGKTRQTSSIFLVHYKAKSQELSLALDV